MELLAMYSDGDRSDSAEDSSDAGEKDISPPRVQPSFTPDLQAEWESFEKLISAGHESVKQVQQHPPLDVDKLTGVAEAKEERSESSRCGGAVAGDGSIGASEKPTSSVPVNTGIGYNSGTQSPWSVSSNPDSDSVTDVKKQPVAEIKVSSRSPSISPDAHSRSTSPADDKEAEKVSCHHSRSSTPARSSPSRSESESARSRSSSHDRSHTQKSRSHSRSQSRSKSRSPHSKSRTSRHRRRKHNHRSKSRSRSKGRRHRKSGSPHKRGKHRRRSRSREQFRSKERRRSRSRDRFGRSTRGRDYYKERSSPPPRRKSHSRDRSQDRSRDRESHRTSSSRDHGRRDHRDASGRNKEKPLSFKEQMRQGLIKASKMWTESNGSLSEFIEEKKAEPSTEPPNSLNTAILNNLAAVQNSTVTPQVALLQTMAAMHKKAQEMTGIAVPKYYNPAAVNPLKYAEQVQKRKLLWARPPKEKGPENQWEGTHFSTDQDGKMAAKFRKLMGMKPEEGYSDIQPMPPGHAAVMAMHNSATATATATASAGSGSSGIASGGLVNCDDRKKQQEDLFTRLDKEYEFARMTTHTHRGVGLGFQSQNFYQH